MSAKAKAKAKAKPPAPSPPASLPSRLKKHFNFNNKATLKVGLEIIIFVAIGISSVKKR
uniref:Uncharacterized protein n=1 Tax=Phlebia radiata TaxID=5308 RepID=L8B967_PHLRA|nr:hypothetical protein PRA_mt0098 [Phlebia radiata]CCE89202.1 hypothetical protein PRA_mt0098 [Phlebia radiata]